jgi:hypothetical protein
VTTDTDTAPVFLSVPDAPVPAAPASAEDDRMVWPTETLAEGLVALQGRLPRIHKGETANVKSDKGNYSYRYADLADVSAELLPILSEVGLGFTARPTLADGAFVLAYALVHVSGEREEGVYPLPSGGTPQAIGSAITYARRYCLLAVTGAAPDNEDDDAAAAMPPRAGSGRATGAGSPGPSVDTGWVAEARRRIAAARTRDDLQVVWKAIGPALAEGRIDQATADQVADAVHARADQVDDGPPPDAPAEAPAPVDPPAERVRADQDAAAERPAPLVDHGRPPVDRPIAAPPRESTLDELRERAARIARQHSQNGIDQ